MRRALVLLLLLACAGAAAAPARLLIPEVPPWLAATPPGGRASSGAVAVGGSNGYLIEAGADMASWRGVLQRRGMSVNAKGEVLLAPQVQWDAAMLLDGSTGGAPQPSPAARNIYTLAGAATVQFQWEQLAPAQKAALDAGAAGAGAARLAFLRGARDGEAGRPGGTFRQRASVLGDALRSAPVLVGGSSGAMQGPGYAAFHAAHRQRGAVVYLGTNDGMLHAIDAANGAELFAYVPNAVFPQLADLAQPGYRHHAFVDATAGHGEAFIAGSWRTVLASGMGMGARGVFALDVSSPAHFDKGLGALWEFTGADDPAMGHVSAPPLVARFLVGDSVGRRSYRDFVVVSSGVNGDSANGVLFLLALDKPAQADWKEGVNYYRFATSDADAASPNALAAPALALAGDGSVLQAYAGDLQGRLWRFDFTGGPPWKKARPQAPLFVARDEQGRSQPIAHAPGVVFARGGGYLVVFGTGRLLETADLDQPSFVPQSLYAVHDGAPRQRSELLRRTLAGSGPYTILGMADPPPEKGWFMDFPNAGAEGERAAGSVLVAGGTVFADTVSPGTDRSRPPVLRSYVVDALSGFAYDDHGEAKPGMLSGQAVQGRAGVAPVVLGLLTAAGARTPTGGMDVTRSIGLLRLRADGKGVEVATTRQRMPAGRLAWREVANWQELHEAGKK